MDLVTGIYGLVAFSVIVLFLGTLNYFIGRSHSDIQIAESQKQSSRCPNHKKKARRQRQAAAAAAAAVAAAKANENTNNNEDDQATESISSEKHIEEDDDEDSAIQLTNENDDEFEEPSAFENSGSSIQEVKDEKQQFLIPAKQKTKTKNNRANSESINQSNNNNNNNINSVKPHASVAPIANETFPHYSLPPRFRQRQQKDFNNRQKSRTKKFEQMNKNLQSIEPNDYSSESESLTG